jgi:uncharacterized protein YaiI (UPF0178 family)
MSCGHRWLAQSRPLGASNVRMVLVSDGADAANDWIAERDIETALAS